jgi:hypothetical protein
MPRLLIVALSLVPAVLILAVPAASSAADEKSASSEQRVFELRTYYTNAGKLNDLNKRFRDHTNQIFKKHGMEVVGFWTPQDEKEDKDGNGGKLIYLLAYPSREAAKKSWDAFGKDPEWQKARAESEKDGGLVKKVESVYLDPTDYSPIK